jgi:hypothetical protein
VHTYSEESEDLGAFAFLDP